MKIILLTDSGEAKSIGSYGLRLAAAFAFLLILPMLAALALQPVSGPAPTEQALVAEWQGKLAEQRSELEALRAKSAAESRAVGRQLARMQARLLRMEALGTRVTQMADLDEGEFSFDEPVALGGPVAAVNEPMGWADLQSRLDALAGNLKGREAELEVLHSLLRNQEYREATVVAGRPVTWGWMSSSFGKRVDPFSGQSAWHSGVDFAGKAGSETVAVASGVVTYAGKRSGYGKMVEINHGDGYVTRYGHHEALTVELGDIVKKGQAIGAMGSSGRSTGPHVHFEVLKNGRKVDPSRYVVRR